MKIIKWIVFTILTLSALAYAASAQTISPIVSEFNKAHAKGSFTATNNALVPQVVTIKAYSVAVVAGKTVYRELDPTAHVRLSETSAKVQPRQAHFFDYDILCLRSPCAVAFVSTFSGQHLTEGIKVDFKIPSTAYVCTDRKRDCRKYIRQTVWGLPAGQ